MTTDVELRSHGTVREIVLTAPERLNALNRAMLEELRDAVAQVAADKDASVLVVSGAGRAFCAGADVTSLFGDTSRAPHVIREELKSVYAGFLGIHDLTIPTIAAVQGAAVGAGVNIALACDVVIAGPSARFVVSFADIGLHPGGGCSWFLTRKLGTSRAMSIILGGQTIGAEQALQLGLAIEISEEPTAWALAQASHWATRDAGFLRDMKRAVLLARDGGLDDVLELESWAQATSVTKPAFQDFLAGFGR